MAASHYLASVAGHDALLQAVRDLAANQNAIGATIAGGGSSYVVGDLLTVSGGTPVSSLTAVLEVTSVAAGVIDGIRVYSCGAYSATPGNPVSVTGGSGTGATFNLTWETQVWTVNRDETVSPTFGPATGMDTINRELILQGPGNAGADEIHVAFVSYQNTARSANNWTIIGATGFDSGLDLENQPGNSWADLYRGYVPLTNGTIEAWIYTTPRWLMGVARIGTTYMSYCGGFLNTFGTPTEFPYPLWISGCSTRVDALASDSGPVAGGLIDPGYFSSYYSLGPAFLRNTSGVWREFNNWGYNGTSKFDSNDRAIAPMNHPPPSSGLWSSDDIFCVVNTNKDWSTFIPPAGDPGQPIAFMLPTPSTPNNEPALVPNFAWELSSPGPVRQLFGELPDVYWIPTNELNLVSQDRVIVQGVYYRVFQNCNQSNTFSHFAIREDA